MAAALLVNALLVNALLVNALFMVVEVAVGVIAHSLALLSGAAHMRPNS